MHTCVQVYFFTPVCTCEICKDMDNRCNAWLGRESYSVDARALEGCEVDGVPNHAVSVLRGAAPSVLTVFAKDPRSLDRQAIAPTYKCIPLMLGGRAEDGTIKETFCFCFCPPPPQG